MSSNIFSNSDGKNKEEFQEKVDTHSKAIIRVIERQKDLESNIDLLNEKLELLDHNSIKNFKSIFHDIKSIKTTQREIKQKLIEQKEFNLKVTKQIRLMSTKDETLKLEKYIDFWNPMNFATKEDLEKSREKSIKEIKKIIEEFLK